MYKTKCASAHEIYSQLPPAMRRSKSSSTLCSHNHQRQQEYSVGTPSRRHVPLHVCQIDLGEPAFKAQPMPAFYRKRSMSADNISLLCGSACSRSIKAASTHSGDSAGYRPPFYPASATKHSPIAGDPLAERVRSAKEIYGALSVSYATFKPQSAPYIIQKYLQSKAEIMAKAPTPAAVSHQLAPRTSRIYVAKRPSDLSITKPAQSVFAPRQMSTAVVRTRSNTSHHVLVPATKHDRGPAQCAVHGRQDNSLGTPRSKSMDRLDSSVTNRVVAPHISMQTYSAHTNRSRNPGSLVSKHIQQFTTNDAAKTSHSRRIARAPSQSSDRTSEDPQRTFSLSNQSSRMTTPETEFTGPILPRNVHLNDNVTQSRVAINTGHRPGEGSSKQENVSARAKARQYQQTLQEIRTSEHSLPKSDVRTDKSRVTKLVSDVNAVPRKGDTNTHTKVNAINKVTNQMGDTLVADHSEMVAATKSKLSNLSPKKVQIVDNTDASSHGVRSTKKELPQIPRKPKNLATTHSTDHKFDDRKPNGPPSINVNGKTDYGVSNITNKKNGEQNSMVLITTTSTSRNASSSPTILNYTFTDIHATTTVTPINRSSTTDNSAFANTQQTSIPQKVHQPMNNSSAMFPPSKPKQIRIPLSAGAQDIMKEMTNGSTIQTNLQDSSSHAEKPAKDSLQHVINAAAEVITASGNIRSKNLDVCVPLNISSSQYVTDGLRDKNVRAIRMTANNAGNQPTTFASGFMSQGIIQNSLPHSVVVIVPSTIDPDSMDIGFDQIFSTNIFTQSNEVAVIDLSDEILREKVNFWLNTSICFEPDSKGSVDQDVKTTKLNTYGEIMAIEKCTRFRVQVAQTTRPRLKFEFMHSTDMASSITYLEFPIKSLYIIRSKVIEPDVMQRLAAIASILSDKQTIVIDTDFSKGVWEIMTRSMETRNSNGKLTFDARDTARSTARNVRPEANDNTSAPNGVSTTVHKVHAEGNGGTGHQAMGISTRSGAAFIQERQTPDLVRSVESQNYREPREPAADSATTSQNLNSLKFRMQPPGTMDHNNTSQTNRSGGQVNATYSTRQALPGIGGDSISKATPPMNGSFPPNMYDTRVSPNKNRPSGIIAENSPTVRDGVVRETDKVDGVQPESGTTRSMLSHWRNLESSTK